MRKCHVLKTRCLWKKYRSGGKMFWGVFDKISERQDLGDSPGHQAVVEMMESLRVTQRYSLISFPPLTLSAIYRGHSCGYLDLEVSGGGRCILDCWNIYFSSLTTFRQNDKTLCFKSHWANRVSEETCEVALIPSPAFRNIISICFEIFLNIVFTLPFIILMALPLTEHLSKIEIAKNN